MKLRAKSDPNIVFDCPREAGNFLLAALPDRIEIVPPAPRPKRTQSLTWQAGVSANGYTVVVFVRCETCRTASTIYNFTGTRKPVHACCGATAYADECPQGVRKEVERLKAEIKARQTVDGMEMLRYLEGQKRLDEQIARITEERW